MTDWIGLSPAALALFCAAIFGAAVLRGFSGFGFALAAVPLIAMLVAPARAVAIVVLVQTVMGLRDITQHHAIIDRPGVVRLSLGALVGTPLGIGGLLMLDAPTVRLCIAAIVAIGVLFLLQKPRHGVKLRPSLALPTGFLSGLFGGLAAMPGPPAVAYYLSGSTPANISRASLMVFFFVTSLLALPGLILGNLIDVESLILSLIALPVMLGGTMIGSHFFKLAPSSSYRPIALATLVVMAGGSGLRGILDLFG